MHDVFHPAGAETWKTSVTSTITTDAVLVISVVIGHFDANVIILNAERGAYLQNNNV